MTNAKTWEDVPSDYQQKLIEWYNVSELDKADFELLADLYHNEQFSYWACPECRETIRVATPDSWDDFQGVCQDEVLGRLCSECASTYLRLQRYAEA